MDTQEREHYIHRVFVWGIVLKLLNGALEIAAGVGLFFSGPIARLIEPIIQQELFEDPQDFFATHTQDILSSITGEARFFAIFFLLSHGVIKIALAVGILRNKIWAFPTAIMVFTLFGVYQIYRYSYTHSTFLLVLTFLDAIIIALTWHEYQFFKKHHYIPK